MIFGEGQQHFASPEEALQHFGVKGMRWGVRKKQDKEPRQLSESEQYLKDNDLGHDEEGSQHRLKKPQSLDVDTSRGFADITSTKGLRTEEGKKYHKQMIDTFEELRKEYPAVRDLTVEIAPMGRVPGASALAWSGSPAAVAHLRKNEVRIMYNEKSGLTPSDPVETKRFIPGFYEPNYIGRHEMGHVLASAGGIMTPGFAKKSDGSEYSISELNQMNESRHKAAFERHGMTFDQLKGLGPYAASKPSEAFAELYGNYSTPSLRKNMDPSLVKNAESLFNELGRKKP